MKNGRRIVALVTVLMMAAGLMTGAAAEEISSGIFQLPGVQARPTPTPEVTQAPTPAPEATQAPTAEPTAVPEATEAPTAEPTAVPEVTEAPTAEPTQAPEATEAPTAEPTATPDPLAGLRQIVVVLPEGETEIALMAQADGEGEALAMIPAGTMLYVKEIDTQWSYAVYGELEGYVLTEKIALYNAEITPEEEEIVRTISVTSNMEGRVVVNEGETVVLTAALTGFDQVECVMQWQYTPDGGATVYDVEGANGLTYAYPITRENVGYLYRLSITVLAPQEPAAE